MFRRFHHLTAGGFGLCFASTTIATLYHYLLGLQAPYPVASLPVLLGTLGGIGFTMSIFIANLAFPDEATLAAAKLSILSASILAGLLGALLFRLAGRNAAS